MKNNGNVGKAGASFIFMGMNIPRTALLVMIVILVVFAALGVGGYLLYTNDNYYSTDDAQVTGNIVNIDAMATGTLNSLTVHVGDFVRTNEIIGTVKIQGSYATETLIAHFSGVIVWQYSGRNIKIYQEGVSACKRAAIHPQASAVDPLPLIDR